MHKKIIILLFLFSSVLSYSEENNQNINLLNKIGYGVTEKSLNLLKEKGKEKWIIEQLDNPFLYDDSEIENKYKFPLNNSDLFIEYKNNDFLLSKKPTTEYYFGENGIVIRNLMQRNDYAINSENRIREMMVWFWFNHFNIGVYTNSVSQMFLNDFENKIRKNALGNFKDLLKIVSHHPSMLYYLNNFQNRFIKNKNDPIYGLNENYAREFLELHTMGVNSGYLQKDIEELARLFTGFTLVNFIDYPNNIKNWNNINSYQDMVNIINDEYKNSNKEYVLKDFFLFRGEFHDYGDKKILGQTIKGEGYNEINKFIDIISENPKTAYFLSKKIAVYLMNDNPSENIIQEMSKKYLESHGDIASTIKPLLLSQEFNNSVKNKDKIKDTYSFTLSTIKSSIQNNPIGNKDINNWLINFLIFIEATPYYKNTPEGFSVYGKEWLSSARLQENIFYIISLLNRHESIFKNNFPINYTFLSVIANRKITNKKEAIEFLTSEDWLKR